MTISRSIDYSLYFVLESPLCKRDPLFTVREALAGGAGIIQLRDKDSSYEEKIILGREIMKLCSQYGAVFIVNDSLDLTLELSADGIHVGKEDDSIESIRAKIGNKIIGYSPVSIEDAVSAEISGADYLGAGAVFPTESKRDVGAAHGIEYVREMVKRVKIPVVGIGGINLANAELVKETGAAGIAVITAISQDDNPREASVKLRKIFL
ncbi:MAG: thiamine phosphate synthase [Spirochaetes bacterium]|jgi:thiamine-phosphate pyrophosphorylase|nr:thiamine phosphate synthase [Spirochaetota bacterium]